MLLCHGKNLRNCIVRACALVAFQEDYIDPDSFHDDDNYVEPEEHLASSKEVLCADRRNLKTKSMTVMSIIRLPVSIISPKIQ